MNASQHLAELRAYIDRFRARCATKRWLGALFHVGVVEVIQQDLSAAHCVIAETAYSAAVHDDEAVAVLKAALSDGLTADDVPAIEQAIRLAQISAAKDREISDATTAPVFFAHAHREIAKF